MRFLLPLLLASCAIQSPPAVFIAPPLENTHLVFEITYTNLADQEWVALWSPYSNCCFYPVPMDFLTNTGHSIIFSHDMHMPTNFGYWKFEKKAQ